jgi:energy-coupling factor transporter ATP-binding protein EcfA2
MTKNYPEAIAHYPRSTQIFIKTIFNRVHSGKNALIVVVGQTGSGKSLSTLSLMIGLYLYTYGKMPSVEDLINHNCFKANELMRNLNAIKGNAKEIWNWDEAGVDIGHKSHATVKNRVIGYLAQTFRNLQQIVFFTVPTMNFIDASVRKLLHFYLETQSIDSSRKMCIIKPLQLQYYQRKDKLYYHNLRYAHKNGEWEEVDTIGVPIPPKEYVEAYETKKNLFTRRLNIEIERQLNMIEAKSEGGGPKLTERQEKILELMQNGIVSSGEIAEKLGILQQQVCDNLNFMRRKGISIPKYARSLDFSTFNTQIAQMPT